MTAPDHMKVHGIAWSYTDGSRYDVTTVEPAIIDVATERLRQQTAEGYDAGHDDRYTDDELPRAALCYLAQVFDPVPDGAVPRLWPWPNEFWKPKARRSNLVRAAALIVAEIERLDRQFIDLPF